MTAVPDYATDTAAGRPEKPHGRPAMSKPMVPVDRGIPMPTKGTAGCYTVAPPGRRRFPWTVMQVGDSFIYPNCRNLILTRRNASTNICYRHAMQPERFFQATVVEKGQILVRIWRKS